MTIRTFRLLNFMVPYHAIEWVRPDPSAGIIHVKVAGMPEPIMVVDQRQVHELVHYMEQWTGERARDRGDQPEGSIWSKLDL